MKYKCIHLLPKRFVGEPETGDASYFICMQKVDLKTLTENVKQIFISLFCVLN